MEKKPKQTKREIMNEIKAKIETEGGTYLTGLTSDESEHEEKSKPIKEVTNLLKPKKERSQSQIDAFEKARQKRKEYAELRQNGIKEVKETYKKQHYIKKADRIQEPIENKKDIPKVKPIEIVVKEKKEVLKKEESDEEPIVKKAVVKEKAVIKKPEKIKRQPRIIYHNESDSNSDSENEIIIIKKKNKKNKEIKEKTKEPLEEQPQSQPVEQPQLISQRKLFFV